MMQLLLALTILAAMVSRLPAQAPCETVPDTVRELTAPPSAGMLLPRASMIALGTAAVATAAVFPVDARVQAIVLRPDVQSNVGLQRTASALAGAGGQALFVAAASLLFAGRVLGLYHLAHVGVHLAETLHSLPP